jgi:DNA ligase-1
MIKRPMLASPADMGSLRFPMFLSPKLDGVRAMVVDGQLRTRSLKPVANLYTQAKFSLPQLTGLDGELIVGEPNHPDVYRTTNSAVSTITGEPRVVFHVFDFFGVNEGYADRKVRVHQHQWPDVAIVPQHIVYDLEQVSSFEAKYIKQGYEGVMLRSYDSPYKQGRSTANEQYLLKVKRFKDSDAEILTMEELMHNANEAKQNELGYTERSSHKENMVGTGRMGALVVRDIHSGVEFKIGTGFYDAERQDMWNRKVELWGKIVKYKFQPAGVKDKPRFPVFLGMRQASDL